MEKLPDLSKWWEYSREELLGVAYWLSGQLPPNDPKTRQEAWEKLKEKLNKRHPLPAGIQPHQE